MPATNTPVRETKTLSFQVKATGIVTDENGQEFGQIEAYGAAFNNVDEGNDRILPGAFTRTIQNSKARAKTRGKKYILKMLWQHDANEIIGGWYELKEDGEGLLAKGDIALATQRGREYYALTKAGMSDEFSIIYDVMQGGAKYDKSGVRDLTELRLFSIDPVTFPMNDDPHTVAVKSLEHKSVCGDTSLPIGPRDESWDGSKAKKQIFAYAEKADGSIDTAKAKKCFLKLDGDAQEKGSYGYPFCYVEAGSPRISVGGVKACAGALSGARGADAGGESAGMKKKVETLYKRINAKYPDDPELTPPWADDGKSRGKPMERKTFAESYMQAMCRDLLEDWQDVYVSALTSAIVDACKAGDMLESDVSEAIDAFKEQVLSQFVTQAQQYGLSQYLTDNAVSPADYTMQNGSSSYGWMSRPDDSMLMKAGRSISAANQDALSTVASNLRDAAQTHMKLVKAHVKAVNTAADDLATILQGAEDAYGTDPGTPEDGRQEGKALAEAYQELKLLRIGNTK